MAARSLLPLSSAFRSSTITSAMTAVKNKYERLPTDVVPKNYNLTLHPDLTEFTFSGKEVIDVEVLV